MENLLVNITIFATLLFLYVTIVFIIAQIKQDNSIMDIAYGPAFFTALIGTAIWTDVTGVLPAIVTACVGIWSARLSTRIFRKNYGKPEDARYAAWREAWSQKSKLYFYVRSYLQINLLQAVIILIVAMPTILALSFPEAYSPAFLYIGLGVFIFGLLYESIADAQLDAFLARKRAGTETATLMTTGLFQYSRRPNYFGESLIWWGLAIMVLPIPFGWIGLVGPLMITYIVTKVTGPMLEAIFLEKYPDEYRAYMARTSYFIPLPPRTSN